MKKKENKNPVSLDRVKGKIKGSPFEEKVSHIASSIQSLFEELELSPLEQMAIVEIIKGGLEAKLVMLLVENEFDLKHKKKK